MNVVDGDGFRYADNLPFDDQQIYTDILYRLSLINSASALPREQLIALCAEAAKEINRLRNMLHAIEVGVA